jgi:hypothetical protein
MGAGETPISLLRMAGIDFAQEGRRTATPRRRLLISKSHFDMLIVNSAFRVPGALVSASSELFVKKKQLCHTCYHAAAF